MFLIPLCLVGSMVLLVPEGGLWFIQDHPVLAPTHPWLVSSALPRCSIERSSDASQPAVSELLSLPLSLAQSAATSVTAVNQQLPAALTLRLLVASEQTG